MEGAAFVWDELGSSGNSFRRVEEAKDGLTKAGRVSDAASRVSQGARGASTMKIADSLKCLCRKPQKRLIGGLSGC